MERAIYAGSGLTDSKDPYKAGQELIESAIKNAGSEPDFAFVFCSAAKYGQNASAIKQFVRGVNNAIKKANPNCQWMGCTTAGELSNFGFTRFTAIAGVISSEYLKGSMAIGEGVHKDPRGLARKIVRKALSGIKIDAYLDPYIHFIAMKHKRPEDLMKLHPYALLTLSNGVSGKQLSIDFDLLAGVHDVIGYSCPVIGGCAGDDFALRKTYTFANGKVYEDAFIVMALLSDLKLGYNMEHGFEPTGQVAFVSKMDKQGFVVKELNGKPAIDVLAEWLDKPKEELSRMVKLKGGAEIANITLIAQTFPLAIKNGEKFVLRVPLYFDKSGGLVFGAKIPKNSVLYLMKGSRKSVIQAAPKCIDTALSEYKIKKPAFSLVFDCSLREMLLGKDTAKEVRLIKQKLKSPFVGFYTYGEHSVPKGGTANSHNQTITSLTISEELCYM